MRLCFLKASDGESQLCIQSIILRIILQNHPDIKCVQYSPEIIQNDAITIIGIVGENHRRTRVSD